MLLKTLCYPTSPSLAAHTQEQVTSVESLFKTLGEMLVSMLPAKTHPHVHAWGPPIKLCNSPRSKHSWWWRWSCCCHMLLPRQREICVRKIVGDWGREGGSLSEWASCLSGLSFSCQAAPSSNQHTSPCEQERCSPVPCREGTHTLTHPNTHNFTQKPCSRKLHHSSQN